MSINTKDECEFFQLNEQRDLNHMGKYGKIQHPFHMITGM